MRSESWVWLSGLVLGLTLGIVLGTAHGRRTLLAEGRDANRLLSVGYTIIDPEGCEVARFDE